MARSFRDQKPAVAAQRRLERDDAGEIVLPRIVVRRPRRGDVHPLPARALRYLMRREIPAEYLLGLTRIELRPRPTEVVGQPYGYYTPDEKAIILYSLPMAWAWRSKPKDSTLASMRRFFAFIDESGPGAFVMWPGVEVLSVWFFIDVLAHELAHHHRTQYRIRRGGAMRRRQEEALADLHSARFYDALVKTLHARKNR
jgi:hypothetical protein